MKQILLFLAVLCSWHFSMAMPSDPRIETKQLSESAEFINSEELYFVDEEQAFAENTQLKKQLNPVDAAQNLFSHLPVAVEELRSKILSLLQFAKQGGGFGNSYEAYNRKVHFGGWVNDKRDNTCLNTRAKVLVRDSKTEVTMNDKGCTVLAGTWDEPYTGFEHHQASEIQIDHFVPLKNAYISGAFKWNFAKRCLYANFLGNDFHLISADSHENQSKSDRTPEKYMPPNQRYACQYLSQWLKVKLIWNLALVPSEKETLISLIKENNCRASDFVYSQQELQEQRNFIDDNMILCQ